MRRAVFLDRDGVINRAVVRNGKPYPPGSLKELELLPGVAEASESLKVAGFLLVVLTNQPDVARGKTDKAVVEAINHSLLNRLPLDDAFTCYHDDTDHCDCRKPLPGLFHRAREKYGISLADSYMVGDRWRDIEAGRNAGCRTVFIDYHYAEPQPAPPPDYRCNTLREAAQWILQAHLTKQKP